MLNLMPCLSSFVFDKLSLSMWSPFGCHIEGGGANFFAPKRFPTKFLVIGFHEVISYYCKLPSFRI